MHSNGRADFDEQMMKLVNRTIPYHKHVWPVEVRF
jgi:hypothetical protein